MYRIIGALLLALLLATACASSTAATPPRDLTERAAGIATLEAISSQAQATWAADVAHATATAAAATSIAHAAATATADQRQVQAQSTAGAVTATHQAVAFYATIAAAGGHATATAIANSGTATAVAHLAQFDQQRLSAEATRLASDNRKAAAEAQRAEYWAQFTQYLPWLALLLLAALAAGIFHWQRRRALPIIITANGRQEILVHPSMYARLPAPRGDLPALPPPSTPITVPAPLPALADGHVLVAGETGSGKSTAMAAVLAARAHVLVLDPHGAPGEWGKAITVGAGRDFPAIADIMQQMRQELSDRYARRAAGQRRFDEMTIAVDEMPAIVSAVGRDIEDTWREMLREGRKVGLFLVLCTQSTRVRTLGIQGEGDLLENFSHVLVLGKAAVNDYPDLAAGMSRPAILRSGGAAPRPVVIPHRIAAHQVRGDVGADGDIMTLIAEAAADTASSSFNQADADADLLQSRGPFRSRRQVALALCGLDNGDSYTRADAALSILSARGVAWALNLSSTSM